LFTGIFSRFGFIVTVALGTMAAAVSNAATWYVDTSATGANNGTSWANAWKSLSSVSASPGDTVYISGGASGSSETYSISTWNLPQGSSSGIITYQIGQDSAHNGTAIFNAGGSGNPFFNGSLSYTTVLGDAGDGKMHFAITGLGGPTISLSSFTSLRIGYINWGTVNYAMHFPSASGGSSTLELDHMYYYKVPNPNADEEWALEFLFAGGSTYDVIKFHDNTVYLPRVANTGGYGDDGIDIQGSGYSIYNNTVISYTTNANLFNSVEAGAHQDSSQETIGSYFKVYNNTFIGGGNSCLFLDAYSGSFTHGRIYNNIMYDDSPLLGYPRGIDAIPDGGPIVSSITFSDIVIANNLFANFGYVNGTWMGMFGLRFDAIATTASVSYSGNVVENNIGINAGFDITSSGTVSADNVEVDGANTGNFVSYVQLPATSPVDNYHLLSTASSFIGKGANLSAYFSTDKDGNTRPATGAWDLGPYEYGASGSPPVEGLSIGAIAVAGTNVDQTTGQMYPGTYTLTATAVETGTNSVTNAWTHAINGGATVLDSAGSGASLSETFTIPAGSVGSSYVIKALAGDGVASVNSQLSFTVVSAPVPTSILTFPAVSGTLASPMTAVTNGSTTYIWQPVNTTTSGAGTATYPFTITNGGNYEVQLTVNVTNASNDSIFLSIDNPPVSPTDICDFTVSSGFQGELADWRGTGSDGNDQYNPVVFALATGAHTLTVSGRDAYVPIENITLLYVNTNAGYAPPTVSAITQSGVDVDPNAPGIQVYPGLQENYSATGAVYNGATMTWKWSYTINGGAPTVFQSGSGSIPAISYTYPNNSGGSNYVWTVQVGDGVSNVVSQLAVGVETPPAPGAGLTFQATNGVLTPPMVATNGYIYQPTYTSPETNPADGGIALYSFSITNSGSYVIQALVNAPSASESSFWVNIDSIPVDPTDIWNCVVTTNGFQQELVTWQGNGTVASPQFVPEVWSLGVGTHSLYFVGREADTELESFSILKVPTAPSGLHVM
jgi:hypothetical protein